jgi:hypothetical protein
LHAWEKKAAYTHPLNTKTSRKETTWKTEACIDNIKIDPRSRFEECWLESSDP